MRIVIDLDNTLCTEKQDSMTYEDVEPIEDMVEYIRKMKEEGHYIIIYTARNMVTQDSNIGKVNANVGKITLDWLDNWCIPYDEIYFGKPYGDIYIDDKALKPIEALELNKLPGEKEDIIKAYLNITYSFSNFIKRLFC